VIGVSLKAYFGVGQTRRWLAAVAELSREAAHPELWVAPSFLSLDAAWRILAGTQVGLAAQDVFWERGGPYTGEITAPMLAELGVAYAEVGHAERRRLFGEDDAITARKAAAAVRAGLVPVVCIGETGGDAAETCLIQAEAVLGALPEDADVIFAYEPVWAIGAAAPAPAGHVINVAERLRERFELRSGRTRLLYGGSAGPGLFASLAGAVDGLFLGRFAHDIHNLRSVLAEVNSAQVAC
jgi:triosephosphate isomerase